MYLLFGAPNNSRSYKSAVSYNLREEKHRNKTTPLLFSPACRPGAHCCSTRLLLFPPLPLETTADTHSSTPIHAGRIFRRYPSFLLPFGLTQLCAEGCVDKGFDFMGLQHADECWCGSLGDEQKHTQYGEGKCNMPCAGDSSVTCGASTLIHTLAVSPQFYTSYTSEVVVHARIDERKNKKKQKKHARTTRSLGPPSRLYLFVLAMTHRSLQYGSSARHLTVCTHENICTREFPGWVKIESRVEGLRFCPR